MAKSKAKSNGHKPPPARSTGSRLSDFRPQPRNANRHKPLGMKHLGDSISAYGLADGITVAVDGESISGSARLEKLAEIMPGVKIQTVDTDGHTLLVNRRIDIATADSPEAQALSAAANLVARNNYDPDGEMLAALAAEDETLKRMIEADELSLKAIQMFVDNPEFKEYDEGATDGLVICVCKTCGHKHAATKN